jgi:hypothetical protein
MISPNVRPFPQTLPDSRLKPLLHPRHNICPIRQQHDKKRLPQRPLDRVRKGDEPEQYRLRPEFLSLTGAISIPSNAWGIPSTGCERIETLIGVLRRRHTPVRAFLCVDFQQSLKAKREKSSFGSKEGLMPTDASGSKSKERGFKICRGIVKHKTEVRPDPRSHGNALGEVRFYAPICL